MSQEGKQADTKLDQQDNENNGSKKELEYQFRAILFTDIRKSSELWRLYTDDMNLALDKHEKRMQKFAAMHNGLIVKTIGDAFMIVFGEESSHPVNDEKLKEGISAKNKIIKDAIDAALHIQSNLKKDPIRVGDKERITIRAGVGFGMVKVKDTLIQNCTMKDYFGPTVNIASRMESSVSPVGGLAVALDPDHPLSDDVQKSIKDWSSSVEVVSITDTCQGYQDEKIRRSTRLLNVRDYRCQSTESVKGVGEIKTLKIFM